MASDNYFPTATLLLLINHAAKQEQKRILQTLLCILYSRTSNPQTRSSLWPHIQIQDLHEFISYSSITTVVRRSFYLVTTIALGHSIQSHRSPRQTPQKSRPSDFTWTDWAIFCRAVSEDAHNNCRMFWNHHEFIADAETHSSFTSYLLSWDHTHELPLKPQNLRYLQNRVSAWLWRADSLICVHFTKIINLRPIRLAWRLQVHPKPPD